MAHVRQSIRDNVVTTVTGLSTTGSRVFRTRVYPLETGNLPGLCVWTSTEDSTVSTLTAPKYLDREVEVIVEAYVRGTANYDNTLDTICSEVEAAMAGDLDRGDNAKDTFLTRTELEFSDEGDQPIGMARMTFTVEYRTAENNATVAK